MCGSREGSEPGVEAFENWLAEKLAEYLGVPSHTIDVTEPFANYGLSSRDAVTLSADLEDWLGCSLSPTVAWEYPTVAALAAYLAAECAPGRPGAR